MLDLVDFMVSCDMFDNEILHRGKCTIKDKTYAVTLAFQAGVHSSVLLAIMPLEKAAEISEKRLMLDKEVQADL